MFIAKKVYDELNKRNVELAREVRDLNADNKELRELRKEAIHNNTILIEKNNELTKTNKAVYKLATSNIYDNEKIILRKIKELVQPLHQN